MENTHQLTENEITQLKSIQTSQEDLITSFGELEYQIQNFELKKEELIAQLEKLKKQEISLGKELNEKYGNGTINIETGVFVKAS